MAQDDDYSPREALVEALIDKVRSDPYPSSTMQDMLESLLRPEDVRSYSEVLLEKVRDERFPSISMLQRLQDLS